MNPLNQTEEKREAVPNGVSRVGIAALGVLLQVLWIVWAALKLTRYYAWVQLAISVLAFLLALRIYGRHTNSATKLSWIIVILTFPIFGVCLYLLFIFRSPVRKICLTAYRMDFLCNNIL